MYGLRLEVYPGGETRLVLSKKPEPLLLDCSSKNGTIDLEGVSGGSDLPIEIGKTPDKKSQRASRLVSTSISIAGKNRLRRLTAACDFSVPKGLVLFATATFPAFLPEAKKALASNSAYFQDCVQSWLYKISAEIGWVYCWEFQRRGALHCHWCLVCPSVEVGNRIQASWKDECARLTTAISVRSGVNIWEGSRGVDYSKNKSALQTDCRVVERSVSRYLSKYLSKSCKKLVSRDYCPKRFWGASALVRKWCAEQSQSIEVRCGEFKKVAQEQQSLLGDLEGFCENKFSFAHKFGQGSTHIFYGVDDIWLKQKIQALLSFKQKVAQEYRRSRAVGLSRELFSLRQNIPKRWEKLCELASLPLKRVLMQPTSFVETIPWEDPTFFWELRCLVVLLCLSPQRESRFKALL